MKIDAVPAQLRHSVLQKLDSRAAEFGWRCLSETWLGYKARYVFECANGHRTERHAIAFLYRSDRLRCELCEDDAIEARWMASVVARGGQLLTGPFRGLPERYRLRCAQGHEWETSGHQISRGKWCPDCGRVISAQCNVVADGLERLQAIALKRGGQCLSTAYMRARDRYLFACAKGHRWDSTAQVVVDGHWCPQCAGIARRLTLETMQALAVQRGG